MQGQGGREAAQLPSPPKRGGGARGGSALPLGLRVRGRVGVGGGGQLSSPAFWGVLARAHLHLICMPIHPLPAFPPPPSSPFLPWRKGLSRVPLPAAPHTVPPRGQDNGGGEEVGAGSGPRARPVGTIVLRP